MTESCQQIQLPPLSTLVPPTAGLRYRQQRHALPVPNTREHDLSLRIFSPVILFHDHSCSPANNQSLDQHAPSERAAAPVPLHPHNSLYTHMKKTKISEILETNGRIWSDIGRKGAIWDAIHPHYQQPSHSLAAQHGDRRAFRRNNSPSLPLTPPSHDGYHFKSGYFTTETPADDNSCGSSSSSSSSSSAGDDQQQVHHDIGSSSVSGSHVFHEYPNNTQHSFHHPASSAAAPERASSPLSSTDNRKRRGNLPKPVTAIMKRWLVENCTNPYPTEEEKDWLKRETGLTLNQISNWFINARRRILPMILAKAAALEGTPVMHHKKRRGKPPSAITAARRKMASKRTCQKLLMDDQDFWVSPSKRGFKRSAEHVDEYECMRPTTRARHH